MRRTGLIPSLMTFGQENTQLYQYRCSSCGTMLKETESPIDGAVLRSLKETCSTCGSILQEQTIAVENMACHQPSSSPALLLPAVRQAYDIVPAKLTFDVPEIDSIFGLSTGDRVCISGSRRNANLLVTRLWVRALMPRRYGGLASKNVICIDAGNSANVYQCVSFARQYEIDVRMVLRSVIISRAFTIYQLAGVIVRRLPALISQYKPKMVVISDLLKMFVEDPTVKSREVRYLLREIMRAIEQLPADLIVLASLYNPPSKYDPVVQPAFQKRIDLSRFAIPEGRLELVPTIRR